MFLISLALAPVWNWRSSPFIMACWADGPPSAPRELPPAPRPTPEQEKPDSTFVLFAHPRAIVRSVDVLFNRRSDFWERFLSSPPEPQRSKGVKRKPERGGNNYATYRSDSNSVGVCSGHHAWPSVGGQSPLHRDSHSRWRVFRWWPRYNL